MVAGIISSMVGIVTLLEDKIKAFQSCESCQHLQIKLKVLYLCPSKANVNPTTRSGKNKLPTIRWHDTDHRKWCIQQIFYLTLQIFHCRVFVGADKCLSSHCPATSVLPSKNRGTHIQTHIHSESRLTTGELLEVVFPLWSDPKLYREDNSLLRTMVSSQSDTDTPELKHPATTKSQHSNGSFHVASLIVLFWLSNIM
jgi:hypothetical protein